MGQAAKLSFLAGEPSSPAPTSVPGWPALLWWYSNPQYNLLPVQAQVLSTVVADKRLKNVKRPKEDALPVMFFKDCTVAWVSPHAATIALAIATWKQHCRSSHSRVCARPPCILYRRAVAACSSLLTALRQGG